MTAFLKIDRCGSCGRETPWEWVPALHLAGRPLAGTGVWRSALIDGSCTRCLDAAQSKRRQETRARTLREQFIRLLGGAKPYREFTFEHFRVTPENRTAFEHASRFDPATDNLYLWGPCWNGKTHLAVAILRRWFGRGASIEMVTPFKLVRRLRMKAPDEEKQTIDHFVRVQLLVIDSVDIGADTPFARQILQEILDGRDFSDRAGLVVTSRHSPAGLARKANDWTIPARLAQRCQVIEIKGPNNRMRQASSQ